MELDDVRNLMSDMSGFNEPGMKEVVEVLRENMFLYHPLEDGNATWLQRDALIEAIHELKAITDPKNVFRTVLGPEDKVKLIGIVSEMSERAEEAMSNADFHAAEATLALLMTIDVIGDERVSELLNDVVAKVQANIDATRSSAIQSAEKGEFVAVSEVK